MASWYWFSMRVRHVNDGRAYELILRCRPTAVMVIFKLLGHVTRTTAKVASLSFLGSDMAFDNSLLRYWE